MFTRRFEPPQPVNKSFSKSHKASKSSSSFSKSSGVSKHRHESRHSRRPTTATTSSTATEDTAMGNNLTSAIITLVVGTEQRLFAAHEDILCASPFFQNILRSPYSTDAGTGAKRVALPDEEPEIFSSVLEYLYKGDYYPRLMHNKHRNSWELEDAVRGTPQSSPNPAEHHRGGRAAAMPPTPTTTNTPSEATIHVAACEQHILRDTVIYCAAERYGLEELKRLALRKQGLQTGIDVGTILRSAQYAYAHTPDSDSRLRAHYLALIIRCRKTFKRSGTMQTEMEQGGSKLFFDLFVAMCNHLDDVIDHSNARTPKTV